MLLNNEKSKLGLGIGVSLLNKTIAFDQINLEDPNDRLLNINVPTSGTTPDFDFGIYTNTATFKYRRIGNKPA
jgi:hypothetical protein